jgi:hypothetical protein
LKKVVAEMQVCSFEWKKLLLKRVAKKNKRIFKKQKDNRVMKIE